MPCEQRRRGVVPARGPDRLAAPAECVLVVVNARREHRCREVVRRRQFARGAKRIAHDDARVVMAGREREVLQIQAARLYVLLPHETAVHVHFDHRRSGDRCGHRQRRVAHEVRCERELARDGDAGELRVAAERPAADKAVADNPPAQPPAVVEGQAGQPAHGTAWCHAHGVVEEPAGGTHRRLGEHVIVVRAARRQCVVEEPGRRAPVHEPDRCARLQVVHGGAEQARVDRRSTDEGRGRRR